jgi:small nuclear ribonucleoprotein E
MSSRNRSNKMIKQPIQIIFGHLQSKSRVSVALYESDNTIEGTIIGFDEYMNLVLDESTSHEKSGSVTSLGRILLKGENITWISNVG